jgi:hypothetical protein
METLVPERTALRHWHRFTDGVRRSRLLATPARRCFFSSGAMLGPAFTLFNLSMGQDLGVSPFEAMALALPVTGVVALGVTGVAAAGRGLRWGLQAGWLETKNLASRLGVVGDGWVMRGIGAGGDLIDRFEAVGSRWFDEWMARDTSEKEALRAKVQGYLEQLRQKEAELQQLRGETERFSKETTRLGVSARQLEEALSLARTQLAGAERDTKAALMRQWDIHELELSCWNGREWAKVPQTLLLSETIGAGSQARVRVAVNLSPGYGCQLQVVKSFDPSYATDEALMGRFVDEVRLLGTRLHDISGTVKIVGWGTLRQEPVLVMEYVQGGSLAENLRVHGRPELPRAITLLKAIAQIMQAYHARGVVHRDIKPANVVLTRNGAVEIIDFGVAKDLRVTVDRPSTVAVGTAAYMAPESIMPLLEDSSPGWVGPAGPAVDLYALGVIFYQLLTGQSPYEIITGETDVQYIRRVAKIWKEQVESGRPLPDPTGLVAIPFADRELVGQAVAWLRYISQTLLQPQLASRYQEAGALLNDIQTLEGIVARGMSRQQAVAGALQGQT